MANDKDPNRGINVNQSGDGFGTTIAVIVAALILVVGAFLFFGSNWNTAPEGPKLTQNNTITPAPIIEPPAAPEPATPPASQTTTPPADAPAANP